MINSEAINNLLELIDESYERFIGTGMYFPLFLISIIYVLCFLKKGDEKNKKIKILLGIFPIIILLLNINPIFAKLMVEVNGDSVYWRVYWLLPLMIGIPFLFTELIFKADKKISKIGISILCVVVIVVCGEFIYTSENYVKVNNYYKIPDDIFEIILAISNDDEESKIVAGPLEFEIYTRQVDGTITLPEDRSFSGVYNEDSIVTYINNGDYQNIYNKAIEINCNYIIMSNVVEVDDSLANYGFEILCQNDTYTLYKLVAE